MSPKTDIQFQTIREKSRQNIMEAATKLFAVKGFQGTSISEIATAAGISKGLMYNYFTSKEDLLDAIITKGFADAEGPIAAMLQTPDPFEKLHILIEGSFALVTSKSARRHWQFMLSVMTQYEVMKRMKKKFAGYPDQYIDLFEQLFTEMGVPNPRMESFRLAALIDGTMLHYLNLFSQDYPIDEMKDSILKHYEQYRKKK
jgi:AcrR family transcriptional regulator